VTAHHFEIGLAGIDDLRRVAELVSSLLGVQLDEGDSTHYGGFYFRGRHDSGSEVFVFRNFDPLEGEWNYPEALDLPIIVKVFDSESPASAVAAQFEAGVNVPARVIGEYVG
jgi:hypothetical protein